MKKNLLLLTLLTLPFTVNTVNPLEKLKQKKGLSCPNNGYDLHQQAIIEEEKYERKVFLHTLAAQADEEGFRKIQEREAQPFIQEHNAWVATEEAYNQAYETTQIKEEKAQRREAEQRRQAAAQERKQQHQEATLAKYQEQFEKERRERGAAAPAKLSQSQQLPREKLPLEKSLLVELLKDIEKNKLQKSIVVINASKNQSINILPFATKDSEMTYLPQRNISFNSYYYRTIADLPSGALLPSGKSVMIEDYKEKNQKFLALVVIVDTVEGVDREKAYCIDRKGRTLSQEEAGITLKHEGKDYLTF